MRGSKRVAAVIVLGGALVVAGVAGWFGSDETRRITVRAKDIPRSVSVLGSFGKPLGSLLRIRGKWIRPDVLAKDRSLVFHVSEIDGQALHEPIELPSLLVDPIFKARHGRGPRPGETWNWRYDPSDSSPAPTPADGETWEMLGVELGHFNGYSEEAIAETGGPTEQVAPALQEFYTPFEFIAVRKLNPNDVPLSIEACTDGDFATGAPWRLKVDSAGRAELTIETHPKPSIRRFDVPDDKLAEFRAAVAEVRFFELAGEYGEQVPDGSTETLSVKVGDRANTVKIRFLMNWVRHDTAKLREPSRAVRLLVMLRGWFDDPQAVDLHKYERMVLDAAKK